MTIRLPATSSLLRSIRQAVWLYVRFALCCRDVEDLLTEHGLDVSWDGHDEVRSTNFFN